jgi:hypothetical protein
MLSLRSADNGLNTVYAVLPSDATQAQLTTSSGAHDVSTDSGIVGQQTSDAQSLSFSDASGQRHTVPLP